MIRIPWRSCSCDELCDWLVLNSISLLTTETEQVTDLRVKVYQYGYWQQEIHETTDSDKLWHAQPYSDSSKVNQLEHDGECTVIATESDNQHECKRYIADADVDSSDQVDGKEPQKAKITEPKSFQSDLLTNRKKEVHLQMSFVQSCKRVVLLWYTTG